MHGTRSDSVKAGIQSRALALLLVVALGALVVAGLSACGGSSVAGTYVSTRAPSRAWRASRSR